jgi:hypothetical protein
MEKGKEILQRVNQSALLPQCPQLNTRLLERNHDAFGLGGRVVAVADIHRAALLFLGTHNCIAN